MISVIIPYFNRLNKIKKAIDSVFNQTYTDWELILIDDCSLDDTSDITSILQGPDLQHVLHIKNEFNKGPGYSRNRGIDSSKGEFLVFLDSDDELKPEFLERTQSLISDNYLFVYTMSYYRNGEIYKSSNKKFNDVLPTLLLNNRPWHTSSMFWNKKFVSRYNESLKNWEDYLFEFKSALNLNAIAFVAEPLVVIDEVQFDSLSDLSEKEEGIIDRIIAIDLMMLEMDKLSRKSINNYKLLKRNLRLRFINNCLKLNCNNIPELNSSLKELPQNKTLLKFFRTILYRFWK